MSRDDRQRLDDIITTCETIQHHLNREELGDGLVFDAVRMRLVEIGEAARALDPALLATEPAIPWSEVVRMRDQLAHRYFDTLHSIVEHTATQDVAELLAAAERLRARLGDSGD